MNASALLLPARRFNVKNGKANEMCDICIYPALRHLNPYDTSAHGAGVHYSQTLREGRAPVCMHPAASALLTRRTSALARR